MSRRPPQRRKRSFSRCPKGLRTKTAELFICAVTRRSGRLGSLEDGYSQGENALEEYALLTRAASSCVRRRFNRRYFDLCQFVCPDHNTEKGI